MNVTDLYTIFMVCSVCGRRLYIHIGVYHGSMFRIGTLCLLSGLVFSILCVSILYIFTHDEKLLVAGLKNIHIWFGTILRCTCFDHSLLPIFPHALFEILVNLLDLFDVIVKVFARRNPNLHQKIAGALMAILICCIGVVVVVVIVVVVVVRVVVVDIVVSRVAVARHFGGNIIVYAILLVVIADIFHFHRQFGRRLWLLLLAQQSRRRRRRWLHRRRWLLPNDDHLASTADALLAGPFGRRRLPSYLLQATARYARLDLLQNAVDELGGGAGYREFCSVCVCKA